MHTGSAIFAAELLQLALELLLPAPPHHGLRVRDGPCEGRVRQLCKRKDREGMYYFAPKLIYSGRH